MELDAGGELVVSSFAARAPIGAPAAILAIVIGAFVAPLFISAFFDRSFFSRHFDSPGNDYETSLA